MKLLLLSTLSLVTLNAFGQLSMKRLRPEDEGYPMLKKVFIQQDFFSNADYTLKTKTGERQDGELGQNRFRLFANENLYSKGKFNVAATMVYTYESFRYYRNVDAPGDVYQKHQFSTNDFDLMASLSYRDSLFNRPVVYNGTLVLGSRNLFNIKKFSGFVSSALVFRKGLRTVYTLGLLVNVDPTNIVPVFPIVTYWHRFEHSPWEVDVVLPQKFILRRSNVLRGWFSAGAELTSASFFNKSGQFDVSTNGNYEWTSNEIQAGIGYEHLLGKSLLFGVKTGYRGRISNRLNKVYQPFDQYVAKIKNNSGYLSLNAAFIIPNSRLMRPKNGAVKR